MPLDSCTLEQLLWASATPSGASHQHRTCSGGCVAASAKCAHVSACGVVASTTVPFMAPSPAPRSRHIRRSSEDVVACHLPAVSWQGNGPIDGLITRSQKQVRWSESLVHFPAMVARMTVVLTAGSIQISGHADHDASAKRFKGICHAVRLCCRHAAGRIRGRLQQLRVRYLPSHAALETSYAITKTLAIQTTHLWPAPPPCPVPRLPQASATACAAFLLTCNGYAPTSQAAASCPASHSQTPDSAAEKQWQW